MHWCTSSRAKYEVSRICEPDTEARRATYRGPGWSRQAQPWEDRERTEPEPGGGRVAWSCRSHIPPLDRFWKTEEEDRKLIELFEKRGLAIVDGRQRQRVGDGHATRPGRVRKPLRPSTPGCHPGQRHSALRAQIRITDLERVSPRDFRTTAQRLNRSGTLSLEPHRPALGRIRG